MKTTRLIIKIGKVLLIVAVAGLLVVSGMSIFQSQASSEPNARYQTAEVRRGELVLRVSSTGSLAALGTVEVGTQISGAIEKVCVDYNDRVIKGQVLATIDQSLYRAAVREAEASLAGAQAQLAQAEAEEARNRPLREKEYISDEEYLVYRTDLQSAKATRQSAEAALQRARTNLDYTVIRSPIDGTVIERSIEEGQTVAASLNTPTLFIIAEDLSRMRIEADVDESDIGQIKVGQEASFEVAAYPERKFDGVVTQIRLQPTVEANVVTYTVVVEAANPDGVLLPGMTATIEFVVQKQADALLVPATALRVSLAGDQAPVATGVYLLDEAGTPLHVPVKVGLSDGADTIVTGDGVQVGARVVTGIITAAEAEKRSLFNRLMPRPPDRKKVEEPK